MTALWTSSAIAQSVQGAVSADFEVNGVAFDSREIGSGDLFFALKGEQSDGHLYVDNIYAAGGAGAVVSQPVDGPHILVSDTTKALNQLAIASRARTDAKIIGVTGSVGKTGTKEALFAALNRASMGKAHRSVKSYNNHVGVPLSLSRMPAECQYGIFEMGMNHAGELAQLTRLVRPDVAIITAIAPAHIGHFSGVEAIADAKAEIFQGLTHEGAAIIPYDSPHYERLRKAALRSTKKVVSFGFDEQADVRAIDVVPAQGGGSLVTASFRDDGDGDRSLCFTVAEPGKHWVSNALAILAAVRAVGGDLASAGLALAELTGLDGRGKRHQIELKDGGEALLIDESYNANPVSMKATLDQLSNESCRGKKIVVLGAMGELGDKAQAYHEALADDVIASGAEVIILVGDEMVHAQAQLLELVSEQLDHVREISHVAGSSEAVTKTILAEVTKKISDEDILLIKGSNYLGLAKVVSALVSGEY
ncbi:UDP-N-acetylmuramoyl-tripeptide--D-alanyl-D-alanine ligase [Parasphingorhabdus cellanae]|uniref:UDP-N-acetylmuramoyl-tripeptide--D-alanyl-D-alanine ligase n=1 Tax=Parasphingorhabdus cellanae TaxID=2806553 RepID=A0ABX7T4V0_9SPHN|nr:UDP-N-acetylmuramoyl-tripeptide--D-alanyl-D-alanine ligase [Parasphingorhabdus cellanae]QTD55562.1 UDP-N-acetylmuramoyl-tripeptide--D-alanyl-D-alanine ligase [Parasphingorhabdus cellanae]